MYLFYSISMRIHILKTKLSLKSLMWMRPETQFPNPVKSNGKLERWVNVLPWSLCIYFEFCFSRHTLWLNTFLTQISFFFFPWLFFYFWLGPDKAYKPDAKQSWQEATARGARELLYLVHRPLRCRRWWAGRSDQGWHLAQSSSVLPGKLIYKHI